MPRDLVNEAYVAFIPRTIAGRLLAEAKARIPTPDAWWKGDGGVNPPEGKICAGLAGFNSSWQTLGYLRRTMPIPSDSTEDIYAYNDDPATTFADLHAWFDRAIALAEAEARHA